MNSNFCSKKLETLYELPKISMIKPEGQKDLTFQPSPASVLCSGMSFSVSLFYQNIVISESTLKQSLSLLVDEVPVMAGKISTKNWGGFQSFAHSMIEFKQEHAGVLFRFEERDVHIDRMIANIWENKTPRTLNAIVDHNHRLQPLDPAKNGQELAILDLIRCKDGSIITLHISHILADAGRAFKLMERLSSIYERLHEEEEYVPRKLSYDTWFRQTLDTNAKEDCKRIIRSADVLRVRPRHLLGIPSAITHHMSSKYIPVCFHVPRFSIESLQDQIASQHCGQQRLSKLDIVQALNISLISAARNNRFTPDIGEDVIINVDLSKAYNPGNVHDTLGNSSAFMEISGSQFQGPRNNIMEAIATNATTIRNQVNELYSNPTNNVVNRLQAQDAMSQAPKHLVLAAYLVHGRKEKLASCSALASFPFQQV